MKTDLFYWLLNAGIFGSVIGLGLLALRRVKRLPRRLVYVLWALPLLRLWMPFGLSSTFSLLTLVSRFATRTVTVYQSVSLPDITVSNVVQAADSYFPITYKTNLLEHVFTVAVLVWLVGFSALVLTGLLLYIFTGAEMCNARHLRDNIYVSAHVTAPVLCGIIRPRIVIPAHMETANLDYVLLHENAHAKRKDNLFRCVALLTAALHWYNPLIWLFLKRYMEDLELACDESVAVKLPPSERKAYALALVEAVERRSVFVSAFGGTKIRVRIEKILSYRSLSIGAATALAALLIVIAVTLLTNAAA
jgi:beta-lactamase regulating signal transducer with metallopeptidase domain